MKIAISSDNILLKRIIEKELEDAYQIRQITRSKEILSVLRNEQPEVLIIDIFLRQVNGFEIIHAIEKEFPAILIIVLSDIQSDGLKERAYFMGAHDFISMPMDPQKIKGRILRLIETRNSLFNSKLRDL